MKRTYAILFLLIALPATARSAPEAQFPLETYRKTVALRARIGGQEGRFVFDTAGGLSLLTPQFAEKAGCMAWGRMTGFRMMGDRLDLPFCEDVTVQLASTRTTAPTVGVFDIMSLYPAGAEPVDGLLALDLFAGKTITIDFPAKRLTIESNGSLRERIRSAVEVPARIAREVQGRALAISVGVPTSRGRVWMELDSGNGGTILISKPYAGLFGLDPAKDSPQEIDFPLAGALRVSGMAFTPDMIIDGNIGMPFLKNVAVTLDLTAGRVWITR